jgi:hypothetical protein
MPALDAAEVRATEVDVAEVAGVTKDRTRLDFVKSVTDYSPIGELLSMLPYWDSPLPIEFFFSFSSPLISGKIFLIF